MVPNVSNLSLQRCKIIAQEAKSFIVQNSVNTELFPSAVTFADRKYQFTKKNTEDEKEMKYFDVDVQAVL